MKLIATCPEETKAILIEELQELGCKIIEPLFKAVLFEVTEEQFYQVHLRSRIASNFILVIKESVAAKNPVMLESQARRVAWENYFTSKKTFIVDATQSDRGPEFMTSNDLSKAVRLAIEERFVFKGQAVPKVDLKEPDVRVVVFSRHERCMIGINTSGKALHKRGYKSGDHPAPLKETLAAAVLRLAGYKGEGNLYDPMCGSGTLVIEAAGMALNKAALIHRRKDEFGFERMAIFNRDIWRDVQQQARDEKSPEIPGAIFASDINDRFVDLARDHALRARVERYIQFNSCDFLESKKPAETGLLIANLPYGERLNDGDMAAFYKQIGDHLKKEFSGWRAALLVAEESPYKNIGLKPTRRIPLLNGSIPCRLMIFDLFAGKRDDFVRAKKNPTAAAPQT